MFLSAEVRSAQLNFFVSDNRAIFQTDPNTAVKNKDGEFISDNYYPRCMYYNIYD